MSETPNELQKELDSISFSEIAGKNTSPDKVKADLNLYDGRNTALGYADVSWKSSRPEIVSPSGFVMPPENDAQTVTLTAVFTYQDYPNISAERSFDIVVPAGERKSSTAQLDGDKVRIFIAGDSTACNYPHEGENNRYPQTGWGQVFDEMFGDEAIVVNCARSGRSSKSFLKEDNYRYICDNIRTGDFLFIQFAHNDSKIQDPDRYTSPDDGSYSECIYRFIETARRVGAHPVLCTSITRNIPDDTTLEPYAEVLKQIGEKEDIPVLDLYALTHQTLAEQGDEKFGENYMRLKHKDKRFEDNPEFKRSQYYYDSEFFDNSHLNINGARMVAGLAAQELKRLGCPPANYLK